MSEHNLTHQEFTWHCDEADDAMNLFNYLTQELYISPFKENENRPYVAINSDEKFRKITVTLYAPKHMEERSFWNTLCYTVINRKYRK